MTQFTKKILDMSSSRRESMSRHLCQRSFPLTRIFQIVKCCTQIWLWLGLCLLLRLPFNSSATLTKMTISDLDFLSLDPRKWLDLTLPLLMLMDFWWEYFFVKFVDFENLLFVLYFCLLCYKLRIFSTLSYIIYSEMALQSKSILSYTWLEISLYINKRIQMTFRINTFLKKSLQ